MGVALMRKISTMPFSENEGHEFSENEGHEFFLPQCNACLTLGRQIPTLGTLGGN
jgi:hypothetical protein